MGGSVTGELVQARQQQASRPEGQAWAPWLPGAPGVSNNTYRPSVSESKQQSQAQPQGRVGSPRPIFFPGTNPGGAGRTGPGVLPASERQRRRGGATFRQSWQPRSLPWAGWTEVEGQSAEWQQEERSREAPDPTATGPAKPGGPGLCRLPWPPGSQRQLLHLPRREVTYLAMWTELAARERDPKECLGLLGAPHPAGACWLAVHGLGGGGLLPSQTH